MGVDLGELWKARQWRKLLNFIDNLPINSKTQAAISQDEETMRAAIETAGAETIKPRPPSLAEWSPEVERLTKLIDQMKVLISVLIQVNSKKGTAAPKVEPEPRPESIWPRVQAEVRMRRHRDLVGRLLPGHRRTSDPPPPE